MFFVHQSTQIMLTYRMLFGTYMEPIVREERNSLKSSAVNY